MRLGLLRCLPAPAIAIAHSRSVAFSPPSPTAAITATCRLFALRYRYWWYGWRRVLAILWPVAPTFTAPIAATIFSPAIAVPDIRLSASNSVGIAVTVASATIVYPSAMLLGPADIAIGAAIVAATVAIAISVPVTAAPVMLAIPFVPLSGPIATVMVIHPIALSAAIKDVEAIAGIPVILVPSTAIADIVKAVAIVAVIIAIERAVRIAVIAIIIAVAVVVIAKANTCIIIAG